MEVQEEKTYFNSLTSPKSFHLIMEVHNKFDYIFLKIFVNKYEEQKLALSLGQMLHCWLSTTIIQTNWWGCNWEMKCTTKL